VRMRDDPCVFRGKIVGTTVVGRTVWRGRESGRTLEVVNLRKCAGGSRDKNVSIACSILFTIYGIVT